MEWNGGMDWTGTVEWNGMECGKQLSIKAHARTVPCVCCIISQRGRWGQAAGDWSTILPSARANSWYL